MALLQELKRRNVFRVAAAYVVTAWLLIEISSTLEETLRLPEWADTLLAFILILVFPLVIFFSWVYEITPEGIKRETDVDSDQSTTKETGRKLDRVIIVMMGLALAYFAFDKFTAVDPPTPTNVESESTAVEQPEPAATATNDLSIAVLPFVNMSSDPEQEYFSDGLTEELLNLLAGIDDLKVAARTSSFFYKDKLDTVPMAEVARQLGVAHILEGSVRRGGDKIRVTAQLIKADDGFHLWSETYDRTLDDVFAIQDEIAAAVVDQLAITLLGEAPHARVIDTRSYELALQGRYLFNRRSEGDLQLALELFEEAVEIDPENAAAWVGMTPILLWLPDPPDVEHARIAIDNAIRLDPDNPEAYIRRVLVCWWDPDCESSDEDWQRALELGPNNPLVLGFAAGASMNRGEYTEAIELQRRAVAVDPLYITNIGNLAGFLVLSGFYDEAEPHVLRTLELAPNSSGSLRTLAEIRLLQGRAEETLEIAQDLPNELELYEGGLPGDGIIAMAQHSLGDRDASDAALSRLLLASADKYQVEIAWIYAWRGENDKAFEWIDRALSDKPDRSVQPFTSPYFFPLRSDPRWQEIAAHWPEVTDWPGPTLEGG